MSESTVPVTIKHDGEYCGECQFLQKGIVIDICFCKLHDVVDLWKQDGGKVIRCKKCMEKAVPIEAESAVVLIGNQELDPAEAESIAEYAKLKYPERFKNG